MIIKEYTTNVPIKGEDIKYVGSFVQNDIGQINKLNVLLMDGLNAFDITGFTAITFSVLKPDGTICVDGIGERIAVLDAINGVISINIHNNVMDMKGTCLATLEVYEGGNKLSSSRMRFIVIGDLADNADPTGESTFPALTEILTTWSTDEAARKANELIRIANENQRILNELRRIANEGVNAENIALINQILLTKADKGTTLAAYSINNAYTKDQVDSLLKFYEDQMKYIEALLGILSPGEDPGGINQGAMNGMAIRVNTIEVGTTWIGVPTPTAYAIQYVTLPSITAVSNILVSPTAGAYAYPGTPQEILLSGNIKEYVDSGIHCAWAGLDELGVGQLMFACSKLSTKTVYVDVMEMINVGTATVTDPSVPSSNNHYHDATSIQGMTAYQLDMDSRIKTVDSKIAAFDTKVAADSLAITNLTTASMTAITNKKTEILLEVDAACDDAVARMASYDATLLIPRVDTLETKVGNLTTLATTEKTNLVGAVNEVFQSGNSFKTEVAIAITDKGVPTIATDSKATFVSNIGAIQSGGASRPLIFEVTTTSANTTFEFPAFAPYELEIEWGDGTAKSTVNQVGSNKVTIPHTFSVIGTYTITINGICRYFSYENIINRTIIKKIKQIGDVSASLYKAFNGCTGINNISEIILDCKFLYDISYIFNGCTGITSIHPTLFTGSKVYNIASAFSGCTGLTSLPPLLFSGLNITSSAYLFSGCTSLTSLPNDLFSGCLDFVHGNGTSWIGGTNITTIPEHLLRGFLGKSVAFIFKSVTKLTSIPANLFATVPQITDISQAFVGCTGLTSLPPLLFSGLTITNADDSFYGCTGLTSLTADLFSGCGAFNIGASYSVPFKGTNIATIDSNVMRGFTGNEVSYLFRDLTKLTHAPELWLNPQFTIYTQCFYGCTIADNYASIPVAWK